MPDRSTIYFPPQKLPLSKKTEKWGKQCIEAGEDLAIFRDNKIRASYKNKITNYNLANDILDTQDLEKVTNPMGLQNASFPAKMQNYPVANPKIELLVGEERKRRFDWHVRVINDDAVSDKEKAKKDEIFEFLTQKIQAVHEKVTAEATSSMQNKMQNNPQQITPELRQQAMQKLQEQLQQQLEQELNELNKYLNYDYQDMRERMATHILNYLYKTLDVKDIFSRGFEDVLIAGEEIYCCDIVAGEPLMRKCNPLNIHTVRSGESPYIDDSDIIVEDQYLSPGMVIDDYHDFLKEVDISSIDKGMTGSTDGDFISIGDREPSFPLEELIDVDGNVTGNYGQFWDTEGNIRVTRVLWRSYKKIGLLTYYDLETGEKLETIVAEDRRVNTELGEEIKWMWIGEWWEGTRIGKDIYVKIQPRPIQFRSMTNLSKCSSGYTGISYNINSSRAKSLMDRMKPYQYLYNVFMYRTELAFAKAKGKIGSLDLATVPDHWTPEKWMYYAEIMGWAVKDSFKEANKGAAQGKLAGNMQQNNTVMDLELGNYIQQHISMLQFIELQLGKISGVSDQRQGQIEQRELVGNVERAVTQSSHITEKWFSIHDNVKKQTLAVLLETAKYAYKNRKDKRMQYMLDDKSTSILTLNGPQFNEADYGLTISDGSTDQEMINTLKQLAQIGLQADKINFSQIMDMYMNPSIASMRRRIEKAENDKMQRDQQAQEAQQQHEQQIIQLGQQQEQQTHMNEMEKLEAEYFYKAEIEKMKLASEHAKQATDMDHDGIPDIVEVEKIASVERIKQEEMQIKKQTEQDKINLEREKLKLEREKIKNENANKKAELATKFKIASIKPKQIATKK